MTRGDATLDVCGVIPPVPTFLNIDGTLDSSAQARTVDRLVRAGVDGLLLLGTAGEGPVLPARLRVETLAATIEAADGQLPIVVCCGGQTTNAALERIEQAAEAGAATALLLPPFYYPLSQRHLLRFVEQVAERSSLPIILYHIPSLTGHGFGADLLTELTARPEVVGVKDSGKDLAFHHRLLREVAGPGCAVFQGAASLLLASAVAGSRDSMCPVTALVPEWELALRAALERNDLPTAAGIGQRIDAMASLFALGDGPMPTVFKVIAALLGLGPDTPHDGFVRIEPEQVPRLAARLEELGLNVREGAVLSEATEQEAS